MKVRKKYVGIIIAVLVFIVITILFLPKEDNNTNQNPSNFVSGGEIDEGTRTYDRFGSSGGYTPLILDVRSCEPGRDYVGFGLGHTEFSVEGLKNGKCQFRFGTEIENPNWDGKLDTRCKIPSDKLVKLTVSDQGINFNPIKEYC